MCMGGRHCGPARVYLSLAGFLPGVSFGGRFNKQLIDTYHLKYFSP